MKQKLILSQYEHVPTWLCAVSNQQVSKLCCSKLCGTLHASRTKSWVTVRETMGTNTLYISLITTMKGGAALLKAQYFSTMSPLSFIAINKYAVEQGQFLQISPSWVPSMTCNM